MRCVAHVEKIVSETIKDIKDEFNGTRQLTQEIRDCQESRLVAVDGYWTLGLYCGLTPSGAYYWNRSRETMIYHTSVPDSCRSGISPHVEILDQRISPPPLPSYDN